MKGRERAARETTWSHEPMLWPYAVANFVAESCFWWLDHEFGAVDQPHESDLPWTTPNKILVELPSMRLRDFSRRKAGHPLLVCAPYALHGALIADLAPHHSIVEVLQRSGSDRVYVTDWRSASLEMRFLSIDHYLADLNVAVDEIGAPVDLIGLCQGGWLSLIYAARFPAKVRRLVLVGTPVDVSVKSELSWMAANSPQKALETLVSSEGGIVRGDHVLRFWSRPPDPEAALQRNLSHEVAGDNAVRDRFMRWNSEALNLPGAYYLEVVNWIFRDNRLAKGCFVALGREIRLEHVNVPVFLLVGADDEVVPAEQAMATAPLLGTPAATVEVATVPSNHLGLFIGGRTLAITWPRIARWLQGEPSLRVREAASV